MKHAVILSLMISAFVLTSCRTTEGYRQKMGSYVGASEAELIDAFGVPSDSYELDNGTKVLQYNYSQQSFVADPAFGSSFGHYAGRRHGYSNYTSAYVPLSPPQRVVTSSCQTLFKLNRKRQVIDFGFKGNSCLANEVEVIQ